MAERYDPTDYLYASARLRARETGLLSGTGLARLAECESTAAVAELLVAEGVTALTRADGSPDIDAMLEAFLRDCVDTVRESVPNPELTLFFEYSYDCNNLKVLEKCRVRCVSPDGRLSPLGSIPPEKLRAAFDAGDLSLLPPHLATGLAKARERYAKTGNSRDIDLALDHAVFADMTDAAAPFPPVAALVEKKIDLLNLLTFCRLAGGNELQRALLADAYLPGGTLSLSLLERHFDGGKDALAEALGGNGLAAILTCEGHAAQEKCADELLYREAVRAGRVSFGAEVAVCFLLTAELAAKNLRILTAMLELGRSADAIKGGLRAYDV